MRSRPFAAAVAALALGIAAAPVDAQSGAACDEQSHCIEVPSFTATVTDFRESSTAHERLLSLTIRFQNRTNRPLALGYVQGTALGTDDQGNRYTEVASSLRGLGLIRGNSIDPKFVLRPGESSDGRIELSWRPGNQIIGTQFVAELAVREIDPVQGNQWRLGREHALQFRGFGEAPVPVAAAAPDVAAAMPVVDHCAGRARCYATGPFVAEIVRFDESRRDHNSYYYHHLTFTVRFRNVTNQPLVLAYADRSAVVLDDRGNRYGPSGSDAVTGIGVSRSSSADASFALRPGESRDATFRVQFQARANHVLGTRYAFDFAVEQMEILPRDQVRTAREFAVGFRDLAIGETTPTPGDAVRRLRDALRGRRQ